MKVVPVDIMADWLENGFERKNFDWDKYNILKLTKHEVAQEEINSLFENNFYFAGRILEPDGVDFEEKRYLIFGVIPNGLYFAIVCTRREERIRPISCRRMRNNERTIYDTATKRI